MSNRRVSYQIAHRTESDIVITVWLRTLETKENQSPKSKLKLNLSGLPLTFGEI